MKRTGFDIINWDERLELDIISLRFDDEFLRCLPSYGKVAGGYAGKDYDTTYGEIYLIVENMGDGIYHVCLRDYGFGYTRDLGDGIYELDPDANTNLSDLERALTDLMVRAESGDIDLDAEMKLYYAEAARHLEKVWAHLRKVSAIATGEGKATVAGSEVSSRIVDAGRKPNKQFAFNCMRILKASDPDVETAVRNLCDLSYCKAHGFCALSQEVLLEVSGVGDAADEYVMDGNRRQRYYREPAISVGGKSYVISNDWYPRNRLPFLEWLSGRVAGKA